MMIALPNQDRSWTITLFMPLSDFEALDSPTRLLKFFSQQFPDSIPLIGKHQLVTDFFSTKPSTLLSIKVFQICTLRNPASGSHRNFQLIQFVLLLYSDILKYSKEIIKGIEMRLSHLVLTSS